MIWLNGRESLKEGSFKDRTKIFDWGFDKNKVPSDSLGQNLLWKLDIIQAFISNSCIIHWLSERDWFLEKDCSGKRWLPKGIKKLYQNLHGRNGPPLLCQATIIYHSHSCSKPPSRVWDSLYSRPKQLSQWLIHSRKPTVHELCWERKQTERK